jgi:hypothetical protein
MYLANRINAGGGLNGKKVELVGFDNKVDVQISLVQAQKAADEGIRIITQGSSSSVAAALSDWVTKYNDRVRVRSSMLDRLTPLNTLSQRIAAEAFPSMQAAAPGSFAIDRIMWCACPCLKQSPA